MLLFSSKAFVNVIQLRHGFSLERKLFRAKIQNYYALLRANLSYRFQELSERRAQRRATIGCIVQSAMKILRLEQS